ncbi:NADH:ubiquinone oxidoreductase subunit NDUFA12 [Sphingomonas sp. LaA6.9]|uniref:NADH:ubiquinone oxidoreductase subunit NDUFA12 n=1 Tax=Sphingomonas sp. LaA6.9 TaxID=2919914 RepID=UPI001F4F3671|nr:NADH:ubiquinone oxidoreductase subunit NDUFA12 [Sphingomonas sp. LaA6.9]MCJ8157145.1 NADH:ubiquinone oxidoreductase subunit NDUFA12 [Sphingomonas sp. LaA6.9]
MGVFKNIFTWWEGATFGTALNTMRNGRKVGEDDQGNLYYEGKKAQGGFTRRWVMYKGQNDSSRVPPEWHSWLHHTIDAAPDQAFPPARNWEREPTPNLTGTAEAYRPAGALEKGGRRAAATGDYEAWTPGA